MKKLLSLLLACLMLVTMAACGSKEANNTPAAGNDEPAAEGKVFNIYAWNTEFKEFFEWYYLGSEPYLDTDGDGVKDAYFENAPGKHWVDEGVDFRWTIVPSDNGAYQEALDAALLNQENAAADDKVDMFLAEADYILKYVNEVVTQDAKALGVTDLSNTYKYTVEAASDTNGVMKGVSFQCCPSALIYKRSIAKDVLGTDDPAAVQEALSSWEKFDAVAADAKAKGYYMTPSFAETYRVFSNNTSSPWVDGNKNLQLDAAITAWMDQAEKYVAEGYTLTEGIWDAGKNEQMYAAGKTLCFFGPAWYFNFCMGPAHEDAMGDWAIVEGPEAHFWGGTWLLAPTGSDNNTILADIMNTFITNEEVLTNMVKVNAQFTNNQKVNGAVAADPEYGSEFLGGQNDTAIFCELAKNIKFQNQTIYDQYMNEGLQTYFVEYLKGTVSKEEAMSNFYKYVNEKFPAITVPAA
ncbi:MAG: hypothetical protein Q4B60_07940 [Erysipelotrichaceae bacterium]|nr:hypothetical protein [Erysipelotrichaceae bacterium]